MYVYVYVYVSVYVYVYKPGQDRHKGTGRKGRAEQDKKSGQGELDRQTGQAELDRTGKTGQAKQDIQKETLKVVSSEN